ncbi:MAG: sel1 repeat family protein, partial [Bacilli bacterium]|nr:sel1 repeat family protein [Bacilli bacterium]
ASYWFSRGAKENDARCMYNLALFYEKGIYFSKDLVKAKFWLNKASELGFIKAREYLMKQPQLNN